MQGATGNPADMPNQSYNNFQIPYNFDPLVELHPVYIEMELSDLVNIDTQNGIIYITAYMTLLWMDKRFTWDLKSNNNVTKTFVDMNWIWIPDVTLYNDAGDSNIVDSSAMIFYNGQVQLRRIAFLSSYCEMNIKQFPFDQQTCSLDFASWNGHLNLTAAPKQIKHPVKNNLLSPQLAVSISYTLESFKVQNTIQNEGGKQNSWPFVVYTLKARRNAGYYKSTTIYPILIVSIICVSGLWIPDINSRLGLSVTSVLTIMAVMWSVTSSLPVSNCSTWIQDFSFFFTMVVALCCVENALVAYCQSKQGTPPVWMKYFVECSNKFSRIHDRVYLYFVESRSCYYFCQFYKVFYKVPKPTRRKRKEATQAIESFTRRKTTTDIEMSNMNDEGTERHTHDINDDDKNKDDNLCDSTNIEQNDSDDDNRITITPVIINPLQNMDIVDNVSGQTRKQDNDNDDNDENKFQNDDETNEELPLLEKSEKEVTWERIGRAFDRYMRFILPLTLLIGVCHYYARANNPLVGSAHCK